METCGRCAKLTGRSSSRCPSSPWLRKQAPPYSCKWHFYVLIYIKCWIMSQEHMEAFVLMSAEKDTPVPWHCRVYKQGSRIKSCLLKKVFIHQQWVKRHIFAGWVFKVSMRPSFLCEHSYQSAKLQPLYIVIHHSSYYGMCASDTYCLLAQPAWRDFHFFLRVQVKSQYCALDTASGQH